MIPILGKDVIMQFFDGASYLDFACITECAIEFNTEMVDVRTEGGGVFREIRPKRQSGLASLSGIVVIDGGPFKTFDLIKDYQLQMLPIPWRMIFDSPETGLQEIVTARSYIERSILTGPTNGHSIADFTMPIDGEITITDSTTICNAVIGNLEITAGDPDSGIQARVAYDGVAGAARIEYSIDGGERLVIFSSDPSGFINLSGLAEGGHTVQVWVVCENGLDGETNSIAFPIDSGGEPGPTCALPGIPEMSEITAATATAAWAAASPSPGGGYFWELRFVATDNLAASANTFDLTTNLSGLIDTAEYYFRVKSLCEEGVSESSYQRTDFTAEDAPVCNVPGTPVMSAITDTTATATWTAPSPTPGSGYSWQLLNGVTVIDSGTTGSLSVNLTGLPAGITLTFRVKSICAVGNESGYNSASFDTETTQFKLFWNFTRIPIGSTMQIYQNGSPVVTALITSSGNFNIETSDSIEVTVIGTDGNDFALTVDEGPTNIINVSGTTDIDESFTVGAGFDYFVTASIT